MQTLLLLAAMTVGELDVAVVQTQGPQLVGKTTLNLKIKTSFGTAVVEESQLATIRLGKTSDTLTTSDGTVLRGKQLLDKINLLVGDQVQTLQRKSIKSISVIRLAEPKPGVITNGTAANQMTYHLRVPESYEDGQAIPAIVILHGSNMNSKAYVNTIVRAWPRLAKDYAIVGINGERRSSRSSPTNPAYNYSYVNFVGKSKYRGYPGTDRESPALVSEILTDLKKQLKLNKVFIGGHSQGGYLTYMVMMNYPDLVDGAFPISGGMIFQAEPKAFVKEDIRKLQRRVPLAIVHGTQDPQVAFSMAQDAHASFLDDGFPMIRLFDDERAGHAFALLPIEQAVSWLEDMAADDPAKLLKSAEASWTDGRYRDAIAAFERARSLDKDKNQLKTELDAFSGRVEEHVGPEAKRFAKLIQENKDGSWVDSFLEFHDQFRMSPAAKKPILAYKQLRKEHEKPAQQCYNEARKLFSQRKKDEGYAKYQEVVDKYYASSWYRRMKRWVDERK